MEPIKYYNLTRSSHLINILLNTATQLEEIIIEDGNQGGDWNKYEHDEFLKHIDYFESLYCRLLPEDKNPIKENRGSCLQKKQICTIFNYIKENIDAPITTKELASLVNLSTFYFTRLFRESTGTTPYQYVVKCRINYAKSLLADNTLSITHISLESGYNSLSNFTNTFRKFEGVTPSQFRRESLHRKSTFPFQRTQHRESI